MFLIRFQNYYYYSSKQLSHSGVFQIAKGLIEPRGTSWADSKYGEPRPKAVEARERSTSNARRRGTAWFMSQEWQPSPTASFKSLIWGMLLWKKPMEMGQCFKNAPFFYAQTLHIPNSMGFCFHFLHDAFGISVEVGTRYRCLHPQAVLLPIETSRRDDQIPCSVVKDVLLGDQRNWTAGLMDCCCRVS